MIIIIHSFTTSTQRTILNASMTHAACFKLTLIVSIERARTRAAFAIEICGPGGDIHTDIGFVTHDKPYADRFEIKCASVMVFTIDKTCNVNDNVFFFIRKRNPLVFFGLLVLILITLLLLPHCKTFKIHYRQRR